MIQRATLTKDKYQESHLATVFSNWSRVAYVFLGLFAGSMAFILFIQKDQIIATPLLAWPGYLLFQIMMIGIFTLSIYSVLWALPKGEIQQGRSTFSWWGFWIRDLFMASVFAPFAIVIARVILSSQGEGLFIDLGGIESLFDSATPTTNRILLALMALVIGAVVIFIALIPLWMFSRSISNLWIQLKYGTTVAIFDKKRYNPGDIITVRISSPKKATSTDNRRVFLNLVQKHASTKAPASKEGHKRNYIHSEYKDLTTKQLKEGVTFSLPVTLNQRPVTSAHKDSSQIRYWEILVEKPQKKYWCRFLFLVQ